MDPATQAQINNLQTVINDLDEEFDQLKKYGEDIVTKFSTPRMECTLDDDDDDDMKELFIAMDQEEIKKTINNINTAITQTFKQRITNNKNITKQYPRRFLKYDNGKFPDHPTTGYTFNLNQAPNLCVIDFDLVNRHITQEERDAAKKKGWRVNNKLKDEVQIEDCWTYFDSLLDENDVCVRTGNNGLHIYCNMNGIDTLDNPRHAPYYKYDDKPIDVDVFFAVNKLNDKGLTSVNNIVLPDTQIKTEVKPGIVDHAEYPRKYEFILGNETSLITRSAEYYLNLFNIPIKSKFDEIATKISTKTHSKIQYIADNSEREQVSTELQQALANGINLFHIHRFRAPINIEVTLYTLIMAINALDDKYRELAYEKFDEASFTSNAEACVTESKNELANQRNDNPYNLVSMYRYHAPDYYTQTIKPILSKIGKEKAAKQYEAERSIQEGAQFVTKPQKELSPIPSIEDTKDLIIHNFNMIDDGINFKTLYRKAKMCEYSTENDVISDISRFIRYVASGEHYWVQRSYDDVKKAVIIMKVTKRTMRENMRDVKVKLNGKWKSISSFLYNYLNELSVEGLAFNNTNTTRQLCNIFNGYLHPKVEEVDTSKIQFFLNFVKNVIANNDPQSYEYIMKWIAWILQHPGKKSGVAIVLRGLQGTGKNQFTNVLCKLMRGYVEKNITNISHITGQFNPLLENKMLIVINEMNDQDTSSHANHSAFDALKAIITDNGLTINDKGMSHRNTINVANFILCTNNANPIKMEQSDRRYYLQNVNHKYANDRIYFSNFIHNKKQEGFYSHLLAYFLQMDLIDFDVGDMYVTEEKKAYLENNSISPGDMFINRHYYLLRSKWGMTVEQIENILGVFKIHEIYGFTSKVAMRNFIRQTLRVFKKQIDGVRCNRRYLTAEQASTHYQTDARHDRINDEDDILAIKEEIVADCTGKVDSVNLYEETDAC